MTTFYPSPDIKAREVYCFNDNKDNKLNVIKQSNIPDSYTKSNHGFIDSVRMAYSTHHDLIIRPDDVWLSIATQFATYLDNNSEDLRSKFVSHSGLKELVVAECSNLNTANYDKLSIDMANKISENIKDTNIRDWIIPNFSTTTSTDRVVGSIVLMAGMKKYFSYKFQLCCGLPSVTMLGTEKDWIDITHRAKKLLDYENQKGHMKTWYGLLAPILENFVLSIRGEPNLQWWNQCCTSLTGGSGPRYLSGWLTVFSIWDNEGKWVGDRYKIQDTWSTKIISSEWPIIEDNDLAQGIVTVDVTVDDNGIECKTVLEAGLSGYFCKEKNTIQPYTTWTISHKREEPDKPKFFWR